MRLPTQRNIEFPASRLLRVLLAGLAIWLGLSAVRQSIAASIGQQNIDSAYRLAPGDAEIAAFRAESLSGPDASGAGRAAADILAKQALRDDATVVGAVATLGLNAEIAGDTSAARRLFAYSHALSRRDLRTNLWRIENAVGRGDVPKALRSYDLALRTSSFAPDSLFPILAGAVADMSVRLELTHILAQRPRWGGQFITYIAGNGPDPRSTAELFKNLRRAQVAVPPDASTAVIAALIAAGSFQDAWSYYALITPNADRRRSRDPSFRADPATATAFDWRIGGDAAAMASIHEGRPAGTVDLTVPATGSGVILDQMQMLPPGSYRLDGHADWAAPPEQGRAAWLLRCRDGRELGRVPVAGNNAARDGFDGLINVPPDCPVQNLILLIQASNIAMEISGSIDRAWLRPAE